MTKKIGLGLALFLCFTMARADDAVWSGYRATKKVTLPFKKVVLPVVVRVESVGLTDEQVETKIYSFQKTSEVPEEKRADMLNGDSYTLQIETCRRQALEICPVFQGNNQGTGVIDQGKNIYSCRHLFHNWVVLAAQQNGVTPEKISPPMRLYRSDGRMIYNSARSPTLLHFNIFNGDVRLNEISGELVLKENSKDFLFYLSDFVGFSGEVALTTTGPLPMSERLTSGDRVYYTGYAAATHLFPHGTNEDGGDAPGDTLVTSTGSVIAIASRENLFAADALATPGMSGSLVTLADGTAVGLHCDSTPVTTNTLNKIISPSFFIDGAALGKFWKANEALIFN